MLVESLPNIWFGSIHELQSFRYIQKKLKPTHLFVFVYGANRWATLYPWIHKLEPTLAMCPYTLVDTSTSTFDISKITSTDHNIIVCVDPESIHLFNGTPYACV